MSVAERRDFVSIIVPVYNEAELIQCSLERLRERAPRAEIIVVDGGSDDGTREMARPLCDNLVISSRGRATQMNAGARVAKGSTLWFLHVDTEAPSGCLRLIGEVFGDPRVVGGFFRIRLPQDRIVYRLTDSFAHHAGKLLRIRCGDHGFFCRREVFQRIGGYPELPLMEDVEFFRALHRLGPLRIIKTRLRVNTRRYEQIGPVKLTFSYGLIAALYAIGAPLRLLTAIYQSTCSVSPDRAAPPLFHTWRWRSSAGSRSRAS